MEWISESTGTPRASLTLARMRKPLLQARSAVGSDRGAVGLVVGSLEIRGMERPLQMVMSRSAWRRVAALILDHAWSGDQHQRTFAANLHITYVDRIDHINLCGYH